TDELEAAEAEADEFQAMCARVTAERDADIAHLLDVRNRVLRIAAAEVLPGPDGQDELARERLIQRWLDEARDETELARPALYEAQFRAVRAEAERDALREALGRLVRAAGELYMEGSDGDEDEYAAAYELAEAALASPVQEENE